MPVTCYPAKHPARPYGDAENLSDTKHDESTATWLLRSACHDQSQRVDEMLQSSFSMQPDQPKVDHSPATPAPDRLQDVRDIPHGNGFLNNVRKVLKKLPTKTSSSKASKPIPRPQFKSDIIPRANGFVDTVREAYNKHRALIIRPDDVWMAILSQFSFFVNANAEALRKQFVAHEGKKRLSVYMGTGDRYTVDFGWAARVFTDLMHENVVDPSLRDWILPNFTTTTLNDTTVSAILMMATLKAYFEFFCWIDCGIPKVTLEGERADWEKILTRLEKLKEFGVQTIAWYHMLQPVIARFVRTFDEPDSPEILDFWNTVAHNQPGGSGPSYFSGWISSFCVFNPKGEWIGHQFRTDVVDTTSLDDTLSLTAIEFQSKFFQIWRTNLLTLDGVQYHFQDMDNVPAAYAEVDVLVDDNGKLFKTLMVAGLVGSQILSSGDAKLSGTGQRDTIAPLSGWWMFVLKNTKDD